MIICGESPGRSHRPLQQEFVERSRGVELWALEQSRDEGGRACRRPIEAHVSVERTRSGVQRRKSAVGCHHSKQTVQRAKSVHTEPAGKTSGAFRRVDIHGADVEQVAHEGHELSIVTGCFGEAC